MDEITKRAADEVMRRRDAIVQERTQLLEMRAEIISKLRVLDRELEDCKATARFFALNIAFPEDEREEYERIRQQQREREARERDLIRMRASREASKQESLQLEAKDIALIASVQAERPLSAPNNNEKLEKKRPTVREISLSKLKEAGEAGLKASVIREYMDREYGLSVHDKTVGMTLYRLSQDDLVHRDGHTWFFGAARAETKNPGTEAPGSNNVVK